VERALRGEVLDVLVTAELFPGGAPELWRDWPQEAREDWDEAAHRFTVRMRALAEQHEGRPLVDRRQLDPRRQYRRREHVRPTVEEAWDVIESSLLGPEPSRLTWMDLSFRLAVLVGGHPIIGQRAAQHQLHRLGFVFGGRAGGRDVIRAPCVSCREVVEGWEIEGRECSTCRRRSK